MMEAPRYHVPHSSRWPIIGSFALAVLAFGAVNFIQQSTDKVETEASFGAPVFYIGLALTAYMFFGWFRTVINESVGGMNSKLSIDPFVWAWPGSYFLKLCSSPLSSVRFFMRA